MVRTRINAVATGKGGLLAVALDGEDLLEAAPVARLAAERRAEERDRAFVGRLGADDARPQSQDVHVVMLHALMGRVRVVTDRRTDAPDLVGRDGRTDSRAADEDPPVDLAGDDRVTEPLGKIGVVIGR